jgi:hypothetical protein
MRTRCISEWRDYKGITMVRYLYTKYDYKKGARLRIPIDFNFQSVVHSP